MQHRQLASLLETTSPGKTVAAGDAGLVGYPGSKGGAGVYHQIIRQMPPHRTYVELFAGHASVFRAKRPASMNILVDIDPATIRTVQSYLDTMEDRHTYLIHGDALDWLASAATSLMTDTLVYADPPYLRSTRTRLFYDWEFDSEQQHRSLLLALLEASSLCMVSGYWSALYADMLANWRCVRFPAMTRGGPRTECLWCNFPEPTLLHDPRYAGINFRERERIGRKRDRWQRRFAAMPAAERQVIAEALSQADPVTLAAALRSASPAEKRLERET